MYEICVDHDVILMGVGRNVVVQAVRRMRADTPEYTPATTTRPFRSGDIARLHVNLEEVIASERVRAVPWKETHPWPLDPTRRRGDS